MEALPKRKRLRLQGYDYSSDGAYFITICTEGKGYVLSRIEVVNDEAVVRLSQTGQIVEKYIQSLPGIDAYVIMPHHVHLIIMKSNGKPIASDVRSFKGLTVKNCGGLKWQRNYYEHVIRDEADYKTKRNYIEHNPGRWSEDEYYSTVYSGQ